MFTVPVAPLHSASAHCERVHTQTPANRLTHTHTDTKKGIMIAHNHIKRDARSFASILPPDVAAAIIISIGRYVHAPRNDEINKRTCVRHHAKIRLFTAGGARLSSFPFAHTHTAHKCSAISTGRRGEGERREEGECLVFEFTC